MPPEHGYTHLDDVRETAVPPTGVVETSDVTATATMQDVPKSDQIADVIACKLMNNKKLSYCWETVRRESMPRIAEMDVEMTT